MEFKEYAKLIEERFNKISKGELFRVNVDKKELWNLYLDSFPEGTNEIYKERRSHDCQTCRGFIKKIGNVVAIKNGKLLTIWDVEAKGEYKIVTNALNEFIKKQEISEVFRTNERVAGTVFNIQLLDEGKSITWNHFHGKIQSKYISDQPNTDIGLVNSTINVFKRGLDEITTDSIEIVLDLIDQDSIYRGQEFKEKVEKFKKLKDKYDKLSGGKKDLFHFENYDNFCAKIKNEVIGTLLVDISNGVDLTKAVKSFEDKVAPLNYKRPKSLITQKMIDQAMCTINDLGIEDSLYRRYAKLDDITVNNVLFADRSSAVKMKGSIENLLSKEVKESTKNFDNVEEIFIDDFIENVLPKASELEILVSNDKTSNLVSLIAPKNNDAPNILQWGNNFSWSYNGDVTDSIKEKVKRAGGNIEADLRVSLGWYNYDDLDIHVIEPDGNHVSYINKSGKLDVDMNAGGSSSREAVENVTWNKSYMQKGEYKVNVHNYTKRETVDVGFMIEVEFDGKTTRFHYPIDVADNNTVTAFNLVYDGSGIEFKNINEKMTANGKPKEIWNISTEKFSKVSSIMLSPNYWDNASIGNKHWFFMVDGCNNPENIRGLYNEFLKSDLMEHRKVFEILGSKLKCEFDNEQLSGLGFSSTKRDELVCKVSGSFNRTLKIKF